MVPEADAVFGVLVGVKTAEALSERDRDPVRELVRVVDAVPEAVPVPLQDPDTV